MKNKYVRNVFSTFGMIAILLLYYLCYAHLFNSVTTSGEITGLQSACLSFQSFFLSIAMSLLIQWTSSNKKDLILKNILCILLILSVPLILSKTTAFFNSDHPIAIQIKLKFIYEFVCPNAAVIGLMLILNFLKLKIHAWFLILLYTLLTLWIGYYVYDCTLWMTDQHIYIDEMFSNIVWMRHFHTILVPLIALIYAFFPYGSYGKKEIWRLFISMCTLWAALLIYTSLTPLQVSMSSIIIMLFRYLGLFIIYGWCGHLNAKVSKNI